MVRVQQGDTAAYDALFARHSRSVYGYLLRRTREPELASEIFQETWLKIHKGRHTYRRDQRFRPWLFGIALNAARDAGRRSARRIETVDTEAEFVVPRDRHEERLTLEAAIDRLPEKLRDAFLLGAVHGLDHREVAAQLDISPDNARARISRARAALRQILSVSGLASPTGEGS